MPSCGSQWILSWLTLTCSTDTNLPFCRTYLYPDDVTGYACQPQQSPTTQSAAFTWLDQPDRPLFTSTLIFPSPQRTSSTPEPTSTTSSPTGRTTGSGNSQNPNIPVIVGGSVGGLAVLVLAAVAVFFIEKKNQAVKDSADSADSGAVTAPTYSQLGLGHTSGAHNKEDENEPSPLSRNPPTVIGYYPRDSVSAISQQSDLRMSMQSSGTLVGNQQGTGPGGQPETIQEMATDQQIHEMGTDYKGHEM